MHKNSTEQGAALLTTLTLVAVLTIIATELYQLTSSSSDRLAQLRTLQQAEWYARSAESHGQLVSKRILSQPIVNKGDLTFVYPMQNGQIDITLEPLHHCFNVNSLDSHIRNSGLDKTNTHRQEVMTVLEKLLEGQQVDPYIAKSFVSRLADWIDQDREPVNDLGLETIGINTPMPANNHMLDISEIQQLQILSKEQHEAIIPFLCARFGDSTLSINPNDLEQTDASLLTAMTHNKMDVTTAKQLITSRPISGYSSLDEFFEQPAFKNFEISSEFKTAFSMHRSFYESRVKVRYESLEVYLTSKTSNTDSSAHRVTRYYGERF